MSSFRVARLLRNLHGYMRSPRDTKTVCTHFKNVYQERNTALGRSTDTGFREGGSRYGTPSAVRYRGIRGHSGGILPRHLFKVEVLENGISGIMKPSRCAMSQSNRGFDRTLRTLPAPLDPSQQLTVFLL